MSILASAGRAKIYNTDGTGRDTYVSKNSGGFTNMNNPASAMRGGTLGQKNPTVSAQHIARGGGQGSPGKTIHYHVNGTGRDSYIHCNQGGFMSNYTYMNDRDAYVASLRGYTTTVTQEQKILQNNAKKGAIHTKQDHFVNGQISIRSPKARNGLNMLKASQQFQAERLAQPAKRRSVERFADLEKRESNFLRTSQQFAMYSNARKLGVHSPQPMIGSQSMTANNMLQDRKNSLSQMMLVQTKADGGNASKRLQASERQNILGAVAEQETQDREASLEESPQVGRHRRTNTYNP